MTEISKELLEKYHMGEKETYESEIFYYQTFLKQTDYLAYKLAEGLITKEDKAEEFEARQFCRDEINRLQSEVK